jgi:hypothetical protein
MTGTGAKPAFGPADVGVAESRDYLLREGVEVFELNVEGGAERRCADDQVEAGKRLSTGFS